MYIDVNTTSEEIQSFLSELKFLKSNEFIQNVETPGEGNMNVVLRIQTNLRSFIVKQSRPFVQKYQDIAAPIERITVEHNFYSAVAGSKIAKDTPNILEFYEKSYTLIIEDLGHCEDMSILYSTRVIDKVQLETLVDILKTIHQTKVSDIYPDNLALRKLNYQHMFVLPFLVDNGFSLDTVQDGLETLSLPYKEDALLKEKINLVGERYLAKGDTLIHGDFYPGSWMTRENHIYVIDPEFSFRGFAEFDIGVLSAHCIMATMNANIIEDIKSLYRFDFDTKLMEQISGIEIMRRLIGIAQLPMKRSIDEKKHLLELAHSLIID